MPIGQRELMMILRARDEASRVVSQVRQSMDGLDQATSNAIRQQQHMGVALTTLGTAMVGVGAIGANFLSDAISQGIEFDRTIALALTQADGVQTSMEELGSVVRRIAGEIPVPIAELGAALYDIFSTIDVQVPEAEMLLTEFARAAVAGQVDVQDAATITMQIMNAYKLPVEDVNRVLDVQFELVRAGVGTYGEFAGALGRAVPAAVSAGQSVETLAGMMAFLTRNGLSVEMAATSAARALELFSKPENVYHVEQLGVAVREADGSFRQMNDIITDLANSAGWAQMAEPERKEMFKEIFGIGTIQARRFFDIAIPNFEQLNDLTGRMHGSAGAMQEAYDIMFEQPSSQIQLMINNLDLLRLSFWDHLRPAVEGIIGFFNRLFDVWNSLPSGVQQFIVYVVALGSALLIIVGTITALIGAFLLFKGILAAAGIGLGAFAAGFAIAIAVVLALVAVGYILYRNWDTIKDVAASTWNFIYGIIMMVWESALRPFFNWVADVGVSIWETAQDAVVVAWELIQSAIQTAVDLIIGLWNGLVDAWNAVIEFFTTNTVMVDIWETIALAGQEAWNAIRELALGIINVLTPVVEFLINVFLVAWEVVSTQLEILWTIITTVISAAIAVLTPIIQTFVEFVITLFGHLVVGVQGALDILITILQAAWDVITAVVTATWDNISTIIMTVWDGIVTIIQSAITIISNIIQAFGNLLQGDWSALWENITNIARALWDTITTVIRSAVTVIREVIVGFLDGLRALFTSGWNALVDIVRTVFSTMWLAVVDGIGRIIDLVREIPDRILRALGNLRDILFDAGKQIINGLVDGMKAAFGAVKDTLGGLKNAIVGWKGPPEVDAVLLNNNGMLIMESLIAGFQRMEPEVERYLKGMTGNIGELVEGNYSFNANLHPVGSTPMGTGSGETTITVEPGALQVIIQGNADTDTVRAAEVMMDGKLRELVAMLKQGSRQ